MCNGLYWVCTHSGNMDDENMNVFVIFFSQDLHCSLLLLSVIMLTDILCVCLLCSAVYQ